MTITSDQKREQRGKRIDIHCSLMPNSAWSDLNSKVDTLKLHDVRHNL